MFSWKNLTSGFVSCVALLSGCDALDNVSAQQIENAWVFTYTRTPQGGNDALLTGTAAVVDGCLEIGGNVVVWQREDLDVVTQILAAVDAGDAPEVSVGGSGITTDGGEDLPGTITTHCAAVGVWYANFDTPSISDETESDE